MSEEIKSVKCVFDLAFFFINLSHFSVIFLTWPIVGSLFMLFQDTKFSKIWGQPSFSVVHVKQKRFPLCGCQKCLTSDIGL